MNDQHPASGDRPPRYNHPVGTIVEIDARPHMLPVEHIPGRLTMTDCHTGQPFLVPDGHGGTMLPHYDDYDRLLREGRAVVKLPPTLVASQALAARAEWDMEDLKAIDPGIR